MNRTFLTSLTFATLCATVLPNAAQAAGEPSDDGIVVRPSPMGVPTPQKKLETHRNEQGQIVTEDGRLVQGLPENDTVPNRNMHRTEQETITEDPPHRSATPGEIE